MLTFHIRVCPDDGLLTGLLTGPMLSAALLYVAERQLEAAGDDLLPPSWLIKPLLSDLDAHSILESLVISRRNLVDMSSLCAAFLLVQVFASWSYEWWTRGPNTPDGERTSVPRSEGRRAFLSIAFTICSTVVALMVRKSFEVSGYGLWQST